MTKKLAQAPKIGSQGTLPTAGLEKAQRKSKPRVVKPAYGERPPSDKVAGRMSGTQENAPRSRRSKQAQDPPRQAFEPVSGRTATSAHLPADRSGREHLSSIARAAKPSPVPDTQRAVQALMDDYGQFSDEESLRPVPRRNPLSTQEPTAGESSLTVTLKSKLVRRMRRLLGGRGWTGLGWDWPFELSDPKLYGKPAGTMPHNAPPRTKLGRGCWKFLIYLQSLFEDAPRAGDLTEQNKWLSEKSSQIDKTFKSIDTMVRKISEEYLAVVGDSDNLINDNMELRLAMVKDLMEYIIPMLVSVLQTIFFLGGADTDEDFKPAFREEGTFTDSTLGCLAKAVGWIFSLERALSEELKRRPLDPSSDEESSDGEGRREKKAKDGRQKAKANLRKRRLRLGAYVGEFRRNIATAYDSLDATATKEERRRQTTARQKELDETRLKEEKAEEEERQRRWQAMCQSTQRMRHAPNPLSEKWRKTEAFDAGTAAYRLASQKAASQTVARHNGSSQPTARPLTRVDREPPRPASGRWPPWREEDSLWVLTQLRSRERRPDLRVWADVLERDVEDVWQEVEVLKQSWRSLARERGVEVEPWARA
ncbi:hypothetical protein QBC33DRAFT_450950 [Phialemonium atrogriseum]|uniref:Uncharacterized protein n=1 Tax=Phialemonium atrogriseum TaxID=1093897 RepID=A0AAJ0C069_9PEZI|nr:uncharacterized protein QBC33DRAFT_450950 [Phialemonium atrogriseum]KAK1767735.1 hypothetical protein QBC33DRAFT_450950 [Phialemonium atrogriseum]